MTNFKGQQPLSPFGLVFTDAETKEIGVRSNEPQMMADNKKSDFYVIFAMILCDGNFVLQWNIKFIFTIYVKMVLVSLYI